MSGPDISATPYKGHTYPSDHGPGTHWATDEAWQIIDCIKPGVLSETARAFISGMIAGALVKAKSGKP